MKSESKVKDDPIDNSRPSLTEGWDFYFDNGLMVLTERFLLRRGYCCGNGCRHCPYDGKAECGSK